METLIPNQLEIINGLIDNEVKKAGMPTYELGLSPPLRL